MKDQDIALQTLDGITDLNGEIFIFALISTDSVKVLS